MSCRRQRNVTLMDALAAARCEVSRLENAVVEANMGLAKKAAARWFTHGSPHDLDDLVAEALFGLLHAARTYDPSRGMSLASWAMLCIKKKLHALAGTAADRPDSHLTDGVGAREPRDEPDGDEPDGDGNSLMVAAALFAMTPRQREAVRHRYGIGTAPLTGAQAAREMGVAGKSNVFHLAADGLEAARKALATPAAANSPGEAV